MFYAEFNIALIHLLKLAASTSRCHFYWLVCQLPYRINFPGIVCSVLLHLAVLFNEGALYKCFALLEDSQMPTTEATDIPENNYCNGS